VTEPAETEPAPDEDSIPVRPRVDKKRLDEIFGDVLPDTTSDERDGSSGGYSEQWYQDNRPPHHG
jgi:hypothetical protein